MCVYIYLLTVLMTKFNLLYPNDRTLETELRIISGFLKEWMSNKNEHCKVDSQ